MVIELVDARSQSDATFCFRFVLAPYSRPLSAHQLTRDRSAKTKQVHDAAAQLDARIAQDAKLRAQTATAVDASKSALAESAGAASGTGSADDLDDGLGADFDPSQIGLNGTRQGSDAWFSFSEMHTLISHMC